MKHLLLAAKQVVMTQHSVDNFGCAAGVAGKAMIVTAANQESDKKDAHDGCRYTL